MGRSRKIINYQNFIRNCLQTFLKGPCSFLGGVCRLGYPCMRLWSTTTLGLSLKPQKFFVDFFWFHPVNLDLSRGTMIFSLNIAFEWLERQFHLKFVSRCNPPILCLPFCKLRSLFPMYFCQRKVLLGRTNFLSSDSNLALFLENHERFIVAGPLRIFRLLYEWRR